VTVGIDLDPDALRVARIDRPSDMENNVHFSRAASEQLPFSKETFDIALLAWSF
jgi:ubiquinone/menaquinone biosynthesis C-methylase UbiE